VVAALVLLAVGWTDRSFTGYITTHNPLARGSVGEFWGVRLYVDLVAGLFVASLGLLAASLLGGSEEIADRARPSPGLLAVVLLAGTVLLHLTQAGLEWWLAPPWRPHPPVLHLFWLKAGNQAAMAVMAGWSLLAVTGLYRSGRQQLVDRIGQWIGRCLVIGALSWWSAWALWI
jgi:hypothetical protein